MESLRERHKKITIYYIIPFTWHSRKGKAIVTAEKWLPGAGNEGELTAKITRDCFGMREMFHIFIAIIVIWLSTFIITH